MDFGENPFAIEPTDTGKAKPKKRRATSKGLSPSRRRAVFSAFKFLVLVAACLIITIIFASQSQRWLVHRLTNDFDTLTSSEKHSRVLQIAGLGALGIEPLVQRLADPDLEVARTSHALLREAQTQWSLLGRDEQNRRHATMVAAIETVAIHIPDDRTGWATGLLQQTLMSTVERKETAARDLYRNASHAMEMLSISDRAGPSILNPEPLDPLRPRRLTPRQQPLPVSQVDTVDQWTDWPPTQAREASAIDIVNRSEPPPESVDRQPTQTLAQTASVYRSGAAKLQPIPTEEAVVLRDVHAPQETSHQTTEIQSVTHLVDSPMETFDDKSVMHWLGSPHNVLREKAKLELIKRGFDGTQIAIATQVAAGDVPTRIELVKKLAASSGLDPRPWLLMLLDDQNREVRLRTVSVLGTMNDPAIEQRLRMHMVDERDPTVAFRIRRTLDIR